MFTEQKKPKPIRTQQEYEKFKSVDEECLKAKNNNKTEKILSRE